MGNAHANAPLYRRKIDTNGKYLPFPGYTIVAHLLHPLPEPIINLVDHLSKSELRFYYSFLPTTSYHVTINPLENVSNEHLTLLKTEQHKLNEQQTTTICIAEKLIRSSAILIEIQFQDDDYYQSIIRNVRSDDLKQANILHNYVLSWHITLAYQYKTINDSETKTRLDGIIEDILDSHIFPFHIPLDHIRICYYDDLTKFTPIS